MKRLLCSAVVLVLSLITAFGQSRSNRLDELKRLELELELLLGSSQARATYLGRLSANVLDSQSVANPMGIYGSPISGTSIKNPLSPYGMALRNPFATGGNSLELFGQDGQFLGNLNANPLDPDSIANPLGRYGSPLSPTSIKNPLSIYGSPISPLSPNNPLTIQAPRIYAPQSIGPALPLWPKFPE